MLIELGQLIRSLRKKQGWSQARLGIELGISQGQVFRIEKGDIDKPSAQLIQKLSEKLNIDVHTLMKATIENYVEQRETPELLISKLQMAMPVLIPVVASIHAGPSEAVEYAYWERTKNAENLKALKVRGYCMAPLINEGDTIIVDPDLSPSDGNILVCYNDGEIWLKKYGDHQGCSHIYGVVIGINRKL